MEVVVVKDICVCLPLDVRTTFVAVVNNRVHFGSARQKNVSDTHMLFVFFDIYENMLTNETLMVVEYYNDYSCRNVQFSLSDLTSGSRDVKDMFPDDVPTHACTASITHDDCAIEVHYRLEDNV